MIAVIAVALVVVIEVVVVVVIIALSGDTEVLMPGVTFEGVTVDGGPKIVYKACS